MTVYVIKFGVCDIYTDEYMIRTESVTAFNERDAVSILNRKYHDMVDPISIVKQIEVDEFEYE